MTFVVAEIIKRMSKSGNTVNNKLSPLKLSLVWISLLSQCIIYKIIMFASIPQKFAWLYSKNTDSSKQVNKRYFCNIDFRLLVLRCYCLIYNLDFAVCQLQSERSLGYNSDEPDEEVKQNVTQQNRPL